MPRITYENRSYPVYEALNAAGKVVYRATALGIVQANVPPGGSTRIEPRQDESSLDDTTRALYDAIYEAGTDPHKVAKLSKL